MTDSGYQYFNLSELSCTGEDCCGGQSSMDGAFMRYIVALRRELGFPFTVTSAYRCPLHNSRVSKTGKTGTHTQGKAMDIAVSYGQAALLLESAILSGNFKGIGLKQSGKGRFIHLDSRDGDLTIWTY